MKLQIAIDGKAYEVEVEVLQEDAPAAPFQLHALPRFSLDRSVNSRAAQRRTRSPRAPTATSTRPRSAAVPVAGVVIRVNIQPGQQIQANDLMMVLEAMKMETNVTAPTPGVVKTIKVQPQDAVKVNQVLVEFE